MTSKSLFFKWMLEDLKRKFWAIGLAFLSFFFCMPVNTAMNISNLQQMYQNWITNGTTFGEGITAESRYAEKLIGIVETTIGMENPVNVAVIAAASIVMALTGFMYLHSRRQVDFYHSVPIRREWLFAVKYINGILIVLSMYLVNMIFSMGILSAYGVRITDYFSAGLVSFAVHAAGYMINYGLMTIAVMLTGNFFISILGGIVLFSYVPAVIALVKVLMTLFFETLNLRGMNIDGIMINGSPMSGYINVMIQGAKLTPNLYGNMLGHAGIMIVIGVIMAVIACMLYKKRPSESAGKAMAFSVTKTPIKLLLVVPITTASALLFWSIYYELGWAAFGFIIGLIVAHAVIEILYHFEFTKLFSNLHHMAIAAGLALSILAVFRYDLVGYDRYKPTEESFESAAISAYHIRDYLNFGNPYTYENDGRVYQSWNYVTSEMYALEEMKFTDYEIVLRLADAGIQDAKLEKEGRFSDIYNRENGDFWTTLTMAYHLKNGKTVYRNYNVNVTALRDVFERMYVSEEYKLGTIPVLSYKTDDVIGVYEYRDSKILELTRDPVLCAKLLKAYQEEMTTLTLDERAVTSPVTSLRFMTEEEYEYETYVSHQINQNYTGDILPEEMNNVNFYPVYPSFTKTLKLMAEAGAEEFGPVDVNDVLRIDIVSDYYTDEKAYYDAPVSYYEEQVSVVFEDKVSYPVTVAAQDGLRTITLEHDGTDETADVMRQILDVAVCRNLAYMNKLQPLEYGIQVHIYMKDENADTSAYNQKFINYCFHADQIPQFVKDAFNYEEQLSKNVSFGINIPTEN